MGGGIIFSKKSAVERKSPQNIQQLKWLIACWDYDSFSSPDKHLTVTFEGADYPHLGSPRERQRLIGWIVNILFAPAVSYWQTNSPSTSPFSESSLYSPKFLNCINCVNTTLLINPGMCVTFWSLTFMAVIFPLIIKQQFSPFCDYSAGLNQLCITHIDLKRPDRK